MKMDGAHALLEGLVREKVEVVFGYPGGQIIPLYDALLDFPSIRHILVRHEQGAAHAADGYARASGRTGVCFATSGPGATNLTTGLANAMSDSVPLVAVTGQVPVASLGSDAFQEADMTGITMPVCKHSYLVKQAADVPRIVKEAFHIASTGRPGPVLIDFPRDVQQEKCDFRYPAEVELPGYKPNYDAHPHQIKRAARVIAGSVRPVLLAGGGVVASGGGPALAELARKARIPVVCTLLGLGSFPTSDPLFLGMAGMHGLYRANRALNEADLVIAVGTRFSDRVTGPPKGFATKARIVHIDIDPAEVGKNVRVDLPIVADARLALEELTRLVPAAADERGRDRDRWLEEIESWREEEARLLRAQTGRSGAAGGKRTAGSRASADAAGPSESGPRLSPLYVLERLAEWGRRAAGGRALFVTDVGQHQMWAAQRLPVEEPRSFITSGGLGTMGYGLPAALGAKVARPDRPVVLVTGDGSLQMSVQQLATARQHNLGVKIILMNNGYLGMVRQWQELFYDRRYSAVALGGYPDFCRLAEAYGLSAARVASEEELDRRLPETLETEGPALLECLIEPEADVFPMVPPGRNFEHTMLAK